MSKDQLFFVFNLVELHNIRDYFIFPKQFMSLTFMKFFFLPLRNKNLIPYENEGNKEIFDLKKSNSYLLEHKILAAISSTQKGLVQLKKNIKKDFS